jgi:N-acyl-D-aspartate/D-glutamate deacylase
VLIPRAVGREATEAKLALGDTALERGARVFALSYPDVIRARATFRGTLYDGFPGWARVMTLPDDQKLVALQDPDTRARLFAASQSEEAGLMRATLGDWGGVVLADTQTDRYRPYVGTTFAEIATMFGTTPFEALLDAVVADQLATSIIPVPPGDDPESWAFRERTWHDPRVVLGASDAGAHVDMIWT